MNITQELDDLEDKLSEFDDCPICCGVGFFFNGKHYDKCKCKNENRNRPRNTEKFKSKSV